MPHVEKYKMASSKWQLLTEEEKKNDEVTSKNMKSVNVNELNDEQKSKLIDSHRKQLLQEVPYIGKTSI